ncbi:MAG: glutamate racemase [Clostridia bacterium]|nr:glutamate racemase [Clostridia bacterium]
MADNRPIGVMDSGMGGLSVVRSLMKQLPGERFIFWGDNKHAPYGTHTQQEILELTWDIVNRILEQDVKAIVIACNTATSAAAADLREKLDMPVLGLEPALKPAVEYAGDGKVVVLATEATLRLEKYQRLLARFGRNTISLPCPELVEFVEAGDTGSEKVVEYISKKLEPYKNGLQALVLGCTHFVWLREAAQQAAPGVQIFDGNEGLSRYMKVRLERENLLAEGQAGGVELYTTSDDPETLVRMKGFLGI